MASMKTHFEPKTLYRVFEQIDLHDLFKKAQSLHELNKNFHKVLPPELILHLQVINIDANEIIVATDSANWSLNFRFQESLVLQSLHAAFPQYRNFKKIRCRICPSLDFAKETAPTPKKSSAFVPISKQSAKLIQLTADAIKDPRLKKSLLQLARPVYNSTMLAEKR
jgi:hypothetical protein